MMARKMIRLYSFLFYFLAIFMGFALGLMYAGWIEAGKGQMLAAGAIVLGYGVLGSVIGLIAALAVAWWSSRHTIIGINALLAIFLASVIIYYIGVNRGKHTHEPTNLPPQTNVPEMNISSGEDQKEATSEALKLVEPNEFKSQMDIPVSHPEKPGSDMELGMFAPHLGIGHPLYFYSHPIQEWPPQKQNIVDSVTFHLDQYENIAIATAPPWFVPAHEKIDYGFLFMKIRTVYRHTLEVEVNKTGKRSALVSNEAGRVIYWPEFILSKFSIELLDEKSQSIKVKPLDYAGEVNTKYEVLRPIAIRADWVQIHLLDSDLNTVDEGWIRWRENGRLLISYSLLS